MSGDRWHHDKKIAVAGKKSVMRVGVSEIGSVMTGVLSPYGILRHKAGAQNYFIVSK